MPKALYAAETTLIKCMTEILVIQKQERKILRKIDGAVYRDSILLRDLLRRFMKTHQQRLNSIQI